MVLLSRPRNAKIPGSQHDHAQLENAIWGLKSSFRTVDRSGRSLSKGIARSRRRLLPQLLNEKSTRWASQRTQLLPEVDIDQWLACMKASPADEESVPQFEDGEWEALVGSAGKSRVCSKEGGGDQLPEECPPSRASTSSSYDGHTDYMLEVIWNNEVVQEMTDRRSSIAEELQVIKRSSSKDSRRGRRASFSAISERRGSKGSITTVQTRAGTRQSAGARRTGRTSTALSASRLGSKSSLIAFEDDMDGDSSAESQHVPLAPRFQVKVAANRPFSAPLMKRDNLSARHAEAVASATSRRPATARDSSSHRMNGNAPAVLQSSPTQISRPQAFTGPRRPRSAFAPGRESPAELKANGAPMSSASFEPQSRWMPTGGLLDPKLPPTHRRL